MTKFQADGAAWTFAKNVADSDFFTLDPTLCTALNMTYAGVLDLPKPKQNVGRPRNQEGLGG